MKILLVDDDLKNSMLLKRFIETDENGYEVIYANSGKVGLEYYMEYRPDLILLDINMPEMNGFELAETIRKSDKKVIIFFLTDRTEKVDRLHGFSLKGNDYIPKPFYPEELLASNQGRLVERDYILEKVWGDASYSNSLALNVQITYLRRLLSDPSISIISIKKKGYILGQSTNRTEP